MSFLPCTSSAATLDVLSPLVGYAVKTPLERALGLVRPGQGKDIDLVVAASAFCDLVTRVTFFFLDLTQVCLNVLSHLLRPADVPSSPNFPGFFFFPPAFL